MVFKKGYKQTEEHKRKMNLHNFGHFVSEETRLKISNNLERRKKLKECRAKQVLPFKDTTIEVKIQSFLSLLHLEYLAHKYISEITHSYQCDIFIPKQEGIPQKTIIECDGCFYHCCPICKLKTYEWTEKRREVDKLRTKELINKGYKVIRLWEHEIKVMELNDLRSKL